MKTWFWVLVIVIVLVVAYVLLKGNSNVEPVSENAQEEVEGLAGVNEVVGGNNAEGNVVEEPVEQGAQY